jgi:hypothetical protein
VDLEVQTGVCRAANLMFVFPRMNLQAPHHD